MANYCHLSYEDRKNIEDGLNENKSINQISKEINRSHHSILREIDRNKKYSEPSAWNNYKINHPDLDLSCERLKHSPYEAMLFLCDEYVLKSLNCYYIKPDEIILNDSLLKY